MVGPPVGVERVLSGEYVGDGGAVEDEEVVDVGDVGGVVFEFVVFVELVALVERRGDGAQRGPAAALNKREIKGNKRDANWEYRLPESGNNATCSKQKGKIKTNRQIQ